MLCRWASSWPRGKCRSGVVHPVDLRRMLSHTTPVTARCMLHCRRCYTYSERTSDKDIYTFTIPPNALREAY